jgi:hypothetical protein
VQLLIYNFNVSDGLIPQSVLLNTNANGEPAPKRLKLEEESLLQMSDSSVSIKVSVGQ